MFGSKPVSLLLLRYRAVNDVSVENSLGTVPVNEFTASDIDVSIVSLEISRGMLPVNLFVKSCKEVSDVNALNNGEIVPIKYLELKSNVSGVPAPLQVTPVQVTASAPHGSDIAVAPLQFHPTIAVGGDKVGDLVGANEVGAAEAEAVGDGVGDGVGDIVGASGQFLMPSLNAQSASASDC